MLELPEALKKYRVSQKQPLLFPDAELSARRFVGYMGEELRKQCIASRDVCSVVAGLEASNPLRQDFKRELADALENDFAAKVLLHCQAWQSQDAARTKMFRRAMAWKNGDTAENYALLLAKTREKPINRYAGIILDAAKRNDAKFFIRLGRALSDAPRKNFDIERVGKVAVFLVEGWFDNGNHMPDLCYFTDQALADFCQCAFPVAQLTFDNVRKLRQRLKLVKTTEAVVGVEVEGNEILLLPATPNLPDEIQT